MRDSQTYRCKKRGQDKKVIQCHFISNTHWDREWRFSMQRTRHMLVHMMDMLLDILEKYPEYSSFHLDSQTVPIRDYLDGTTGNVTLTVTGELKNGTPFEGSDTIRVIDKGGKS